MKRTIAALLTVLLAVSLLAACGGKNDVSTNITTSGMASAPSAAPQAAPMPEGAYDTDMKDGGYYGEMTEDYAPQDVPGGEGLRNEPGMGYADAPTSAEQQSSTVQTSLNLSEKIIYTVSAEIETVDFDKSVDMVDGLLVSCGGFVEDSYVGGRNYSQAYYGYQTFRTARFTLRVPVQSLTAVTESLETLGNVTSTYNNAQNITSQFIDTESRLKTYRTQEERLLAMLAKADTVADMIVIESSLSEVRYLIESLTSTLMNWQNQVDYSTVTLNIYEVERLSENVPAQRSYFQQITDGLRTNLRGLGRFFLNLFKWLIVSLPVLTVIAAIAAAVAVLILKRVRKKKTADHGAQKSGLDGGDDIDKKQ